MTDDIASPADGETLQDRTRARIVAAAARLLAEGGREALTTRSVSGAADVQAPTIYRLFGDKRGLLDAVAEHGFASYLEEKTGRAPGADPVEALRAGWDLHVAFGLANPAIFAIMYGDPQPDRRSSADVLAQSILRQHVRAVAAAGRLRVSEARATDMIRAAGCGTVFMLLGMPAESRDMGLSTAMRDATMAAIATDAAQTAGSGPSVAAVTLRAALPETDVLTEGERVLMGEWLDRLVDGEN